MKILIDTSVLDEYSISLGEYLALLLKAYGCKYDTCVNSLEDRHIINKDLFSKDDYVLSDNTRQLIAMIQASSNIKLHDCPVRDFNALALRLQSIYPKGCKNGTSYPWRSTTSEVAFKLMTLVNEYGFTFTEEEAINATKQYVEDCKEDTAHMSLLKYFILKTDIDKTGMKDIKSNFMSIIENNRNNEISN